ncbi:MAG: ABC transporter permease [Proteobacteria bacterium]|nr:ABC transporter permease [Pseudomonadota bacterium]
MTRFITRRLLWMIPVLVLIALITFLLMHTAPGGPWDRNPTSRQVDSATQERLNHQFGLDKPMWRQFVAYILGDFDDDGKFVCGAFCGNLGPSYRQRGRTVQEILFTVPEGKVFWKSRFGYSVVLGLLALSFALVVGIPAGIIAALRQNSWIDYLSALIANIGVSVPNFVIGIYLIIIFGVLLHWVSVVPRSWDAPKAWIIPALVLGSGTMAFTARLTRSAMIEVMRQDYIRTARAKGLREAVVVNRHMLKNALIPVITVLGPALANLVTGSFIIETMFGFPGVGREYVQAISNRDYSMILGSTLLYGVLIALSNLSVDVMYGVLDPRIRVE